MLFRSATSESLGINICQECHCRTELDKGVHGYDEDLDPTRSLPTDSEIVLIGLRVMKNVLQDQSNRSRERINGRGRQIFER